MKKRMIMLTAFILCLTVNGEVFQCKSARNCTSDAEEGISQAHCQPDSLKKRSTKIPAIINIVLIIIVGGMGNLLTLISISSALIIHRENFPNLWNSTTILMLHLSLCDMLYCTLGLPVFISVYYHGFLPHSETFCRYNL